MKKINVGSNFAVFLLFFGLAMLEAFQTQSWLKAAFWMAISLVFLLADNPGWRSTLRPEDKR